MFHPRDHGFSLPAVSRRTALQAGAVGLLGMGSAELSALQAMSQAESPAKSVLFIFLNGGISHQDSWDLKPNAPDTVRGEFKPIATKTPGMQICEHLPLLAQRSERYALVRSVETGNSGHGIACHMLFTGRLDMPPAFNPNKVPSVNEWPSIPSLVTYATQGKNNLPPSIVLPEPSVNEAAKFRPGQYAGRLGPEWDAWHVNIAANCPLGNGACPDCFRFSGESFEHASDTIFNTPTLSLPSGGLFRLKGRLGLLDDIEQQQRQLDRFAATQNLDKHRQQALSVLTDPKASEAFNVANADDKTLERYGKNKFGLSLLMGYRLIAAGVNLVQVNLGKNSSWDTHSRNFVNLKENLFPYFDRSVSALLDDLAESGLLDSTLVVMTGEFGRTPKINKNAGRDHWGPLMTSFFAGGGVRGGNIVGSSDKMAAYPASEKQTTENLAATMFHALGVPETATWKAIDGRIHELYRSTPIAALM